MKPTSLLSAQITIGSVTLTQKAIFAKHLAVMLASGMLINEALSVSEEASKGKMKKIISEIRRAVVTGTSLAEALAVHPKVFSDLFIDIVRAGEASGSLPANLENIALQLEKERDLIAKVKGAMIYPIVILIAATVLALGMAYFVLPKIVPLFMGLDIELPLSTRAVIWFSQIVSNHGLALFIGFILFVITFVWTIRQRFSRPVTHFILLRIPVLSQLIKNSNLARFSLTFGTLLKSGLTIDEALTITARTVPNYYYRNKLSTISRAIQKGAPLSPALAASPFLFPKLTTSMVHVGEESGRLADSLLYLASYYEGEVDTSTKALTTAIEPLLLLIIGVVVGTLALSIITPIYEVTGNIRGY